MKDFDLVANAKIAAQRKGISEDQAIKELTEIKERSKSEWSFKMSVNHYLEMSKSTGTGGPHGVDPIDPVHHTKE